MFNFAYGAGMSYKAESNMFVGENGGFRVMSRLFSADQTFGIINACMDDVMMLAS